MPPQRLPIVDSDDGVWGDILRQYLMKEHYNDDTDNAVNGGHKTITVRAGTTGAGTAPIKLTSGSLMSSAEVGAIEFLSDDLYFTRTTGTTRDTFVFATHTQTLTNKTLTAPTIGGTSSLTGTIDYTPDTGTILSLDGTAAITRHGGGNSKSLGIGADDTLFLGGGEARQMAKRPWKSVEIAVLISMCPQITGRRGRIVEPHPSPPLVLLGMAIQYGTLVTMGRVVDSMLTRLMVFKLLHSQPSRVPKH
jgi:hypothetical protein